MTGFLSMFIIVYYKKVYYRGLFSAKNRWHIFRTCNSWKCPISPIISTNFKYVTLNYSRNRQINSNKCCNYFVNCFLVICESSLHCLRILKLKMKYEVWGLVVLKTIFICQQEKDFHKNYCYNSFVQLPETFN